MNDSSFDFRSEVVGSCRFIRNKHACHKDVKYIVTFGRWECSLHDKGRFRS
jgi:hypothetical protein